MKKIFFIFCSLNVCLFLASCGSEGGGCSVEGAWKVSDVKLESSKFSASMIQMMETEYKASIYQFNNDGTMSITSSGGQPTPGTYTLDADKKTLQWKDANQGVENVLQINNCTGTSIELTQRMPADASQAEIATVSMTLAPQQQ